MAWITSYGHIRGNKVTLHDIWSECAGIIDDRQSRRGEASGSAANMRTALLRAYRETRYEVDGICVRVGQRSAAMDKLLMAHHAREAMFITAYNPYSRLMPLGWNQRLQTRLARTLRNRVVLSGNGTWRRWSEAHLVILGDSRSACRLVRQYRQNGIVIVGRKQPARLVLTSWLVVSAKIARLNLYKAA